MSKTLQILFVLLLAAVITSPASVAAQCCGGTAMDDQQSAMVAIHALFANHEKITRTVTKLDNGVETVTESKDPGVAKLIAEHAYAMKVRLEKGQPLHLWDPLFVELFRHAKMITMDIQRTTNGVRVKETSADPYVAKLIQTHADGVTEFIEKGMEAMHKRHEVPEQN